LTSKIAHSASVSSKSFAILEINLIGGLQVFKGTARVTFKKKKAAALLALLAITQDLRISREQLRSLLWPESDEHAAQTSLRNALWALKAALNEVQFDGLNTDRTEVWLEATSVTVDVDRLLEGLERGEVQTLLNYDPKTIANLERDQILINDPTSARMHEMAAHVARLVRQRLITISEAEQSSTQKIALLQFSANMDPSDEGAARRLIRGYWESGQVANALTAYQSLWNLLDEEFGDEPSAETQSLIIEIKASDRSDQANATRPCIIVARSDFDHLPPDLARQAGLLRERLCANLVRFREWQVLDAAFMTEGAKSTSKGAKTYVLNLQTNRIARTLTCRAVLADPETGELLWSEGLGDEGGALGQKKAQAADRLAAALNLHLSTFRGREARPTKPSVYERWVEAQGLILQFKLESWQQAEHLLDALIRDYPDFSRGYSSRSSIENMRQISFPGLYSVPAMHVDGLRFARRSIELDPMDSRAQLAMGWSAAMSRQFDRAELAFDLAFQYNENDPWTITSAAVGLAFCDHFDAALRLLDLLFSLDFNLEPSHWSYVAATRFLGRDYEGCIKASEKSGEISHDVPAWHAAALALTGRQQEATFVAGRFESIARHNWVTRGPVERAEIARWLVSGFPIRNRDTWLALRDGLRLAGMPVPSLIQSDKIASGYRMDTNDSALL